MEHTENIAQVSGGFAELFSKAAAGRNIELLRRAEAANRAAIDTINLEKRAARSDIARSVAQHEGAVIASIAYQGGGVGGTGQALLDSANAVAADQAAIVEANAAAKEVATILGNQPILEDPVLAAITGAQAGADIGISIVQALIAEAPTHTRTIRDEFGNILLQETVLDVGGFNIDDILEDLLGG